METKLRYHTDSESETEAVGKAVAALVKDGDLLALYGEMGSGKTAFTRGLTSVLAPDAGVTSPTSALLNEYEGEKTTVHHFDLYRIASEDDLVSVGFWDIVGSGVTVCEWAENAEGALPLPRWEIRFEKTGETGRDIVLERVEA